MPTIGRDQGNLPGGAHGRSRFAFEFHEELSAAFALCPNGQSTRGRARAGWVGRLSERKTPSGCRSKVPPGVHASHRLFKLLEIPLKAKLGLLPWLMRDGRIETASPGSRAPP